MQSQPFRLNRAEIFELMGTAGLDAFPVGDNLLDIGGTLYSYYQHKRTPHKPSKPVMNRATVRMFHSITRRQFEKRLGGDWYIIEEAQERRTNGRVVTGTGPSKDGSSGKVRFLKKLHGDAALFEARTWTQLAKQIGV